MIRLSFFALMQLKQQRQITITDAMRLLKSTRNRILALFKMLVKQGYVYPLTSTIYLLPPYVPHGGNWTPNVLDVVVQLMQVTKANYIVSGFYAFEHYRSHRNKNSITHITVYNDVLTKTLEIGGTVINFTKVHPDSLVGYVNFTLENNFGTLKLASLPRAIYDALNDPQYDLLADGYRWLEKHVKSPTFMTKFIEIVSSQTPKMTIQRIGYFLETKNISKGSHKLSQLLEGKSRWTPINSHVKKLDLKMQRNTKWKIITDKPEKPKNPFLRKQSRKRRIPLNTDLLCPD